jgi:hypothetical protein
LNFVFTLNGHPLFHSIKKKTTKGTKEPQKFLFDKNFAFVSLKIYVINYSKFSSQAFVRLL